MTTTRNTRPRSDAAVPPGQATRLLEALAAWLLLAIVMAVLGGALFFLWNVIDLGPELSDSAYYVLMREEYSEIEPVLTGFGLLAAAFSGGATGQSIRTVTLAFTFAAPFALLIPATILVWWRCYPKPLVASGLLAAVAASSAYYKWLLLDPSYNGLILPLSYIAASGLWALWSAAGTGKVKTAIIGGVVLGAALYGMLIVRVSSGAVFLVLAVPFIAIAARRQSRIAPRQAYLVFLVAVSGFVFGALALAVWVAAATLPLPVLWARFLTGFEAAAFLSPGDVGLSALLAQLRDSVVLLVSTLFKEPLTILLPLACICLSQIRFPNAWRNIDTVIGWGLVLSSCLLVAENIDAFADMALRAWVFALAASLLVCFLPVREIRLALFALLFGLAPYALSLGTGSAIVPHAAIHAGASITALFLVALSLERNRWAVASATAILGAGTTISALTLAAERPYRMLEPLSAATIRVEAGGETWRVTPAIAETYRAMSELRETQEWQEAQQEGRPVLLDLSGRAPALNWMGNFRVPSVPWTFSGYEGSDRFFAWALERQSDDDLARMWIAKDLPGSEGMRLGHSLGVLNERLRMIGLQFPEDYEAIGPVVPVAYIDREIVIFRPRP